MNDVDYNILAISGLSVLQCVRCLHRHLSDFSARRYASAEYAVVVWPSVRLSVCLTQALAITVPKWPNAGSHNAIR